MQIKLINKLKIEEIQNGRRINTDRLTFSKFEAKYSLYTGKHFQLTEHNLLTVITKTLSYD